MGTHERDVNSQPIIQPLTRRTVLRAGMAGLVLAACGGAAEQATGGGATATERETATERATAGERATAANGENVTLDGMHHTIANVTSLESADRGFQFGVEQLMGEFRSTSYDGDQVAMMSEVRQFPTLGVNGVTSFLVADSAVPEYAQILADEQVAYMNYANRIPWFTPAEPRFNGFFVTHTNGSFAEESFVVARQLFERGGGSGDAIVLGGVKGSASDTARFFGVEVAQREFPDVRIVTREFVNWDTTLAQEAMATLLPSNPDVKFIVALNDSIAIGALAALRAAGNDTALVMGVDGDTPFLEEMIDDPNRVVATAAGRLDHTGVFAAVQLFDFLNGVTRNPLESIINTDSIVLDTPESAQAMLDLIGQEPDPLPWDPVRMSRHLQGEDWIIPHRIEVANPAEFDWGDKPGTNPTPRPADFEWPEAYQEALDAGELATLNEDYEARVEDVYGPVRDAANYDGQGVLGTFRQLGIA